MNALILPGNSPRHAQWVEELKDSLKGNFEEVTTQHYNHWKTGDRLADVDHETSVAQNLASNLEPCVIIGKSIGTIIAARAVAAGALKPTRIILLGVPTNGAVDPQEFSTWLKEITVPVTIIQNAQDPFGSFADVASTFADTSAALVELPGDTHDYQDFDAIINTLT